MKKARFVWIIFEMLAGTRLKRLAIWVCTIIVMLGCILATTGGVSQAQGKPDPNKEYFQQVYAAAAKGNSKAEVCLGSLLSANWQGVPHDDQKAFEWYKKAAAQGFSPGIEAVAGAYQSGKGVPKDPKRALAMYHKLVDQGYLPAATDIGVYYMSNDWGVSKDYAEAIKWYMKAAASGDAMAEVRMGMMYANGWGVKKDPIEAARWLSKATNHRMSCMVDFMNLDFWIVYANLHLPNNIVGILQPFGIKYIYDGGRARKITVIHSSGSRKLDEAYVNALRVAHFPPWPADYHTDDKTLGFWLIRSNSSIEIHSASLIDMIYAAIGNAVVEPWHVLVYGSNGSGKATVKFDYRNGRPTHIRIAQSSGDKYEDAAAIKAVENAHYPATPAGYKNHTMHLDIKIHFASVTPSAASSLQPLESLAPPAGTLNVSPAASSQAPATTAAGAAFQSHTSIPKVGNPDLSDRAVKSNVKYEQLPIQIVSTSWNDPNYIRPIRMQVGFQNTSGKVINSVWLYVAKCAAKGSVEAIPYPLELRGPFDPGNSYSSHPTFPAYYTEFTGPWPGIHGGHYSTHMLITKIDIWYADGFMESYGDDVSRLLGGGISNFCSTNYQ